MKKNKIVFFDVETGGLFCDRNPIIQFAAIAIDNSWKEIESLEMKIQFDEATADKEALEINHYDPDVWAKEAIHQDQALTRITQFFRRHATFQQTSRAGKPYYSAQLAGHNVSTFDIEFLLAFYRYGQPGEGPAAKTDIGRMERGTLDYSRGPWCPARFLTIDTLSIATLWELLCNPQLENLKLSTLASHFGYELGEEAHDALADVRANIAVGRALFMEMWGGVQNSPYLDPKRKRS